MSSKLLNGSILNPEMNLTEWTLKYVLNGNFTVKLFSRSFNSKSIESKMDKKHFEYETYHKSFDLIFCYYLK